MQAWSSTSTNPPIMSGRWRWRRPTTTDPMGNVQPLMDGPGAITRARGALPGALGIWSFAFHRSLAVGHGTLPLSLMLAAALPLSGEAPRQEATRPVKELELRGRVVCLAEEMHRLHQAELPTRHEHLWSLQTEDGSCYVLLRGKYSEAIFLDE